MREQGRERGALEARLEQRTAPLHLWHLLNNGRILLALTNYPYNVRHNGIPTCPTRRTLEIIAVRTSHQRDVGNNVTRTSHQRDVRNNVIRTSHQRDVGNNAIRTSHQEDVRNNAIRTSLQEDVRNNAIRTVN